MASYIELLRNRINLERMPFSDRGSRLLLFKHLGQEQYGLYVKLAERLTALQPGLSTYRSRPPLIQDMHFIDAQGNSLPYRLTTCPHLLEFKTSLGHFRIAFQDQDTLSIGLPPGVIVGIRFRVLPDLWLQNEQGGEFKYVRNVAYSTNGQVVENEVVEQRRGYRIDFRVQSEGDTAITINVRPDMNLQHEVRPFSIVAAEAERRWHRWFERVPPVAERYRSPYYYAWWVMGNNLLSPRGRLTHEVMVPSKVHYIGVWQWDAYFHALAYRHKDMELAQNQLRIMLDHQLPNGMIPDAVYDEETITYLETPVPAAVTKPPITAWVAMKLHETSPALDFLDEIYKPLVRWNTWWFGLNDDDADGIVQYNHPYSSGLDDSPLWDEGMPVESPDLNTYLAIQTESLAEMARLLGRSGEAAMWDKRFRALTQRMVEHFYDPAAGVFWATKDHTPIRVLTPFNLYPLWTGLLDAGITQRLIDRLTDPKEFWTAYPIPSVAKSDPKHDGQQMWRGPTWININYIFVNALRRNGRSGLARELRVRTLDLMMLHDDFYEYYNPDTGDPPPSAAPVFGWSAALFIDLAIQAFREEQEEEEQQT